MKEKLTKKETNSTKSKVRGVGKKGRESSKTLPKGSPTLVTSVAVATTSGTAISQCEDVRIIEPEWQADGILRQALMSFNYSSDSTDRPQQSITIPSDTQLDTAEVISVTSQQIPNEALTPNKVVPIIITDSVSDVRITNEIPSYVTSKMLPTMTHANHQIATILLSDSISSTLLETSLCSSIPHPNLLDASSIIGKSVGVMSKLSLPNPLETTRTVEFQQVSEVDRFDTVPHSSVNNNSILTLTSIPKILPPTISVIPLENAPPLSTSSKDGFLTVVYSSLPGVEQNQIIPLPPMSDLKSKRLLRLNNVPQAPTKLYSQSEINQVITTRDNSLTHIAPITVVNVINNEGVTGNCILKNSLETNTQTRTSLAGLLSSKSSNSVMMNRSTTLPHSQQTFQAEDLGLTTKPSLVPNEHLVTTTSATDLSQKTRKPIKSVQEILDSQSTGTTYTTSYCSPRMAAQNHPNHSNSFNINLIQSPNSFASPLSSTSITSSSNVNSNSQLHALLNNTVTNQTPPSLHALLNSNSQSTNPSIHLLLNSTVSISQPTNPSIHSLLNSTVSQPTNPSIHSLLNSTVSISQPTNPSIHSLLNSTVLNTQPTNPSIHSLLNSTVSQPTNPSIHSLLNSTVSISQPTNPSIHSLLNSTVLNTQPTNPSIHSLLNSSVSISQPTNPSIHSLLNSSVSQPTNPSIHSLLNSSVSISPPSNPSIHSLLNSTVSQPTNPSIHSLLNSTVSISQPTNPSIHSLLNSSVPQPTNPSIHLLLNSSVSQPTNPSIHSLLNSSVSQPTNPSIHSLLNSSVSQPTNPSIHLLLNSTPSISSNCTPSLHSLLNSVPISHPSISPLLTSQNTSSFFTTVTTAPSSPILSTSAMTQSLASTIFTSADTNVYPLHSNSDFLSQQGLITTIFPSMSSSQVSSVLSALASVSSCHLEMDADTSHEIMGTQALHLPTSTSPADKVSSMSEAVVSQMDDSSDLQISECDKDSADKNSSDDTMIVQVMNLLSSEEQDTIHDIDLGNKTDDVLNSSPIAGAKHHVKYEARTNISPMMFIKQEIHESINHRTHHFGRSSSRNHATSRTLIDNTDPGMIGQDIDIKTPSSHNHKNTSSLTHSRKSNAKRRRNEKKQSIFETDNSDFVEQVSCFKCKFCSFLSLQKDEISSHIQKEHCSELPLVTRETSPPPLCSNSPKSNDLDILPQIENICSHLETEEISAELDSNLHSNINSQHLLSDSMKIRVRNLDKEIENVHSNIDLPSSEVDDSFHGDSLQIDEGDLCSNGATGLDERDLNEVLEDDLMSKALKPTIDPCEYKDVKADLTELVVCNAPLVAKPAISLTEEQLACIKSMAKKRGRPRGSRNMPPGALYKTQATDDDLTEKDNGYKCEVDGCAVRLKSHDNIEYHRRCHSGSTYACPECAVETGHWNALVSHLWRVHSIDMELYTCDECNYKTISYSKLVNVHKRIHGDDKPFLCDTCGKGFKNPKQMRNHKVIHDMKRLRSAPNGALIGNCDVCSRSFASMRLLRMHQDNVHRKLRPHLCNFCGYSASSRSTLKMHMRQHTGEKPFACEQCEYRTADHNSLRRHKMRHTGDKPYKCPHCTYACIQSSTYKAHLKNKHPGQDTGLMFSCPSCPFRSVKKDNYVAHMAEHENGVVKPRPKAPKKKLMAQNLPITIVNIDNMTGITTEEHTTVTDMSLVGNLHLLYVNSETGEDFAHPSEVLAVGPMEEPQKKKNKRPSVSLRTPDTNPLEVEHDSDQQMGDFEPEEITGDIREIAQIQEPSELKFKVLQENQ